MINKRMLIKVYVKAKHNFPLLALASSVIFAILLSFFMKNILLLLCIALFQFFGMLFFVVQIKNEKKQVLRFLKRVLRTRDYRLRVQNNAKNPISQNVNALLRTIEEKHKKEDLIANLTMAVINLSQSEFKAELKAVLEMIGLTMNVDRVYFYFVYENATSVGDIHMWQNKKNSVPATEYNQYCHTISQQFLQGLIFEDYSIIPSIDILKETAPNLYQMLDKYEVKNVLATPMTYHEELTGFLVFESIQKAKNWHQEEIQLCLTLSEILVHMLKDKETTEALYLLNQTLEEKVRLRTKELQKTVKKLEEDEEAGKKLQFKLLPPSRQIIENFKFSSKLIPSLYLSGDFVDYFKIDDEHVGFYMADVSGHGVSSGFITFLLKNFISKKIDEFNHKVNDVILQPDQLFDELNTTLLAEDLGKYLTMFYATINFKKNVLRFSNGGQFPFPIYYDGKNYKWLKMENTPIGLFDFTMYDSDEIKLADKFSISCFSDGVLDILPMKETAEKEAFIKHMVMNKLKISEMMNKLNLDDFSDLPDDITIFTVSNWEE